MKTCLSITFLLLFSLSIHSQNAPLNMVMDGQWNGAGEEYNDVWGLTIGSSEYAIVGSRSTIWIFDVTVCSSPVLKYSFSPGSNTTWRDFKTAGGYIFGVCDSCTEGLVVIDASCAVSGGSGCVVYQSTEYFKSAHNIFIDGNELYVAGPKHIDHSNGGPDYLEHLFVLDITNPLMPDSIINVNLDTLENGPGGTADFYYIHDLNVSNGNLYACHGSWEYAIWDVSNLANISKTVSYQTGQYTHSSWNHPSAPYSYVCEEVPTGRPIQILNISGGSIALNGSFFDPLDVPGTSPYHHNLRPHNVFVKGDSLFLSSYHDGVKIYDVSNPVLPSLIGYYDTFPDNDGLGYTAWGGCWGVYPFLPSGCILTSDMTYGLTTVRYSLVVPVEWGSFDVEKTLDKKSMLTWTTQSERNNSHFEIQRSFDGINFQTIATKKGAGDSNELIEYQVVDPLPLNGKNYYKIKQVDFDGGVDFSETKFVSFSDLREFSVGPNPVIGKTLFLNFGAPIEGILNYEVVSTGGQIVTSSNLVRVSDNRFQLTFTDVLPSGHYWVRALQDNDVDQIASFIVK